MRGTICDATVLKLVETTSLNADLSRQCNTAEMYLIYECNTEIYYYQKKKKSVYINKYCTCLSLGEKR